MAEKRFPNWIPSHDCPEHIELADGRVIITPQKAQVLVDDELTHFARLEYEVLLACGIRSPQPVKGHEFARYVWGYDNADDSFIATLRTHVAYIREKLPPELGHHSEGVIRSRRGVGYYAVKHL